MQGKLKTSTKRVAVKVGTSTLTYENGKLNLSRFEKLIRVLSDLKNRDVEVILVSSGAIGVGVGQLRLKRAAVHHHGKTGCCSGRTM